MTPTTAGLIGSRVPAIGRAFALVMTALLMASAMMTTMAARASATDQPASCGVRPIDLVLIMDRSGSMATNEGAHTRLGWAKLAANGLVGDLDAHGGVGGAGIHRVGISTFGGTTTTRNVSLGDAASAATIAAAVNAIGSNGGTPFDIGMAEGADNMTDSDRATHNGVEVTQVLIFLSDGNPDPDSYAPNSTEIANYLASADAAYAIAIGADGGNLGGGGTGVSYALMQSIAKPAYTDPSAPGGFRAVTSGSGLPTLFDAIYEELACPTGTLEVVKNLDPANDGGRFDLWIDQQQLANEAGHNGTTGAQTLIAGTHSFAETADGETNLANYASSASCIDTAHQNAPVAATFAQGAWSLDIGANATVRCTITNTRDTGTLTVTKVVKNDDGGTAVCSAFGFKVNGGATIPFEGDCTNVLTLPTGTYSVSEPAVAGYTATYDACTELQVSEGGNVTCTITNDDQPGTLIVTKEIVTDDGGASTCADFSFAVNGGNPVAFESDCSNSMTVDAGSYSVVEADSDGYQASYANCSQIAVPNGGSATCTITNDDEPGTLTVVKEIIGGDLGCDDFSFAANGGNPTNFEADCSNTMTVPAGSYSVVETAVSGWTTTYDNCSRIAIPNGGSAICTITNTRNTGTVEVVKHLATDGDDGLFDLLVDGSVAKADAGDGDSTGSLTLETGTHSVGEAAGTGTSLADYAGEIECRADGGQGGVIASATGTGPLEFNVTKGADVLCVITNTRVEVSIHKKSDHGDNGTVLPKDTIKFSLEVTVNNGSATNVVVTDELPDGLTYVGGSADPSAGFSISGRDLTWNVGALSAGKHTFTYKAKVDADASGALKNVGCVDADQNDERACDDLTSRVQRVSVAKSNDSPASVVRGSSVGFTLKLTVANGPIDSVSIMDQLPEGLGNATDISDGGTYDAVTNRITWNLSDVSDGDELTYNATVTDTAAPGQHKNVATITDGPCIGDGCEDDSRITVRVPTLTVDKSASAEVVTISGPASSPVATPSVVTWTISWTLTNGPVSNVVITDSIPTGFVFLDAANGGTIAGGKVTWKLATVSSSGSVSFRTTVDPATISRVAPTVNVATIDSDETGPDDGQDSVTVAVQPPPLAGNPTPKPALPDTALGLDAAGGSVPTLLVWLLVASFLGSLGALALGIARERSRR
ncbi:MAG TPA: isopeptide-forming domain-containing fimbrial protein [Candidatus Limnocylindria bacterium]|nr:isopeptide-forming domain-containing fimbrial protein [Candidatus Limnocylindria bacterium]